jgi:hypothetical protein
VHPHPNSKLAKYRIFPIPGKATSGLCPNLDPSFPASSIKDKHKYLPLEEEEIDKMASQVKPNSKPLPYDEKPLPPSPDLETPDDYKNTFKVSRLLAAGDILSEED